MTYLDSVQFLYSLGNEIKTAKLGLERMSVLLAELGHPEQACDWIHVAGTNGKGSVCAMMESALRAAGHRTGLYTSPHLIEPTERIRINGTPITTEEFSAAFDQAHEAASRLLDRGEIDAHPTYFETVTAMAFLHFRASGINVGVIEVGLGGRLDATNVIRPRLCVITPIDFDHENWLGNSIRAIAGEKAGILKRGVPAVFSHQRPEALDTLNSAALELGVNVTRAEEWIVSDLRLDAQGSRFTARRQQTGIEIECPLAGRHQVNNALTAMAGLTSLGIDTAAIQTGIREALWPGRLERVAVKPDIILDGAHNPAGMRSLAEYIAEFHGGRKIWLIFGTMRDKSIGEIGEILSACASEVLLTMPDSPRALRPEALTGVFQQGRVRVTGGLREALALAREAAAEDVIFITGSLFLVGEARAILCHG